MSKRLIFQATAPRYHAVRKAIDAFRRFEAGAKGNKTPLTITIRLKLTMRFKMVL